MEKVSLGKILPTQDETFARSPSIWWLTVLAFGGNLLPDTEIREALQRNAQFRNSYVFSGCLMVFSADTLVSQNAMLSL